MRAHIELRTQENIAAGMSADEARYTARRQFGWAGSIKETCRDQRGINWIEQMIHDLRYGARMLRKNSGSLPWPCSRSRSVSARIPRSSV